MCYSAQVEADYRQYVRRFGATLSLQDFFDTFWRRAQGENLKCPKAMEAAFQDSEDEALAPIRALIAQHHQQQASRWEQELFKQRKRLADAERTLQQRQTRKALDDQRIATQKVSQLMGWLADLRRRTPDAARDHRIYPGQHVPVMVWEDGRRVVKPMRYHCRPAGKPAFFDQKYPGLYNARRDNLQGFWKGQFGHTHGVVLVRRFYENVARHQAEGRELAPGEVAQNVVLAFEPTPPQDLLLACEAEREVSRGLGGSCSMPLAAHARWSAGELQLAAALGDGVAPTRPLLKVVLSAPVDDVSAARALGARAVDALRAQGAAAYLPAA